MKPKVIGIYGVSGCGKTFLLNSLKSNEQLRDKPFSFNEGSEVITQFSAGLLSDVLAKGEDGKAQLREAAIRVVAEQSAAGERCAIVTGHYIIWEEGEEDVPPPVWTDADAEIYTHIIYLDVRGGDLIKRRNEDSSKKRPAMTDDQLENWQDAEKAQLRKVCYDHGILFTVVFAEPEQSLFPRIVTLLLDFTQHSEEENLTRVERRLDDLVVQMAGRCCGGAKLERILVIDGDKTLIAKDTGTLLFQLDAQYQPNLFWEDPLKAIFSSSLGYSYTAFRQAMLVYEELSEFEGREFEGREFEGNSYDQLVVDTAQKAEPYHDFVAFLRKVSDKPHVGLLILTSGLKQVFEELLSCHSLPKTTHLLAGGRVADGFVVTPKVKAAVVSRLKHFHSLETWAFGDSPLDLGMLCKADQAFIVVGSKGSRSKSMENALKVVIEGGILEGARQIIMVEGAPARLNARKLPVVALDELMTDVVKSPDGISVVDATTLQTSTSADDAEAGLADIQVHHATNKSAAKLLMTLTRDAAISGPALRSAHQRIGWYLSHEYLTSIIGLEEYDIKHVQGHIVAGHRLLDEKHTLIIALMRGGEPMAFGVNEAFPLAAFLHAKEPHQVTSKHLEKVKTVILVDSVVNTGKSILEFMERIWDAHEVLRIVVVAGVVQVDAVEKIKNVCRHDAYWGMAKAKKLSLVALRLSGNKFTGQGGTDTGNRLFNTTFMD
ncbi:hypothetical protein H2200_002806 [Cladophialophora chaetospira]|uniref:Phosphoribosyltransferase domain-containing protein n=1 Tax=Cladophialophora chaetospira TaxID=386627 RepID=A0AA38XG57_9EURO|nr:hypothetical protein H2200_002806 [Cladophialophora chaetospira]